uniref:Piezo type mechanosensitive ion channel component 1 n=1 Tax=Otus sunia TaxID=257818 RepID=A0A8C8BN11_9STRI
MGTRLWLLEGLMGLVVWGTLWGPPHRVFHQGWGAAPGASKGQGWSQGPRLPALPRHTGRLLKALLATSILFLLIHFVFQICLYTLPVLDQLLGGGGHPQVLPYLCFPLPRLDLGDIPNSVRLVAPDVGILLVSSLCLCLCRRLVPKAGAAARARRTEPLEPHEWVRASPGATGSIPRWPVPVPSSGRAGWDTGGLAWGRITLPSASSSVYYLLFVGLCTWWACHLPASRLAFDTLCIIVGIYAAGHLLCLYAYQAPFIQGVFPPPTIWARVFGFKDIILYRNCSRPNALVLNTGHPWPVYANPGILLLLYYTVVTLVKLPGSCPSQRTAAPAQPPARCPARELVELESWPKDTDGPMLSPSTGKPGIDADNCTVHLTVSPLSPWPGRRSPAERLPLHTLGHVVMKQSYVCALIAMMVWSITYHSWLTFVLLLWACLIWTVRSRHHFAMLCSPFLLLYGVALCSLRYVWGMDLAPELPTRVGFMSLEQLGLVHPKYPCLDLGAMLLLTLTFWLLLRQFVKEKLLTRRCPTTPLLEVTVSDTEPSRQRDVLKALGGLVRDFYAKYWICVCAGMFIVVSFAGRLVVYKIVYMFLFLLCLTLFQVYYSLWRKVLKGFWWLVVAYTMLVLIAVYTFQFEDFPMYWRNLTGLTDEQLGDLGLEQFSVSELFSSTLIPGFFLLACILQLHYFHRPFMHITDLEHVPAPGKGLGSAGMGLGCPPSREGYGDGLGCPLNQQGAGWEGTEMDWGVLQQWRVFEAERTEEWRRAAGDNSDRLDLAQDPRNPTPNFIHCRSYLDMVKVVVFRYLFWFVLVVVFITGATRISLFGLGYLLACFYLLLFGTAMLRKPARARLVLWDCLILYNITVIISKNMLSLLSCVFVQQMQNNFCWVIQLFSLVCTVKGYYDPKEMGKDHDCSLPVEEAGIIWDSICFFFLLLQRRIFLSYYFLHVMLDLQASALQASRLGLGAQRVLGCGGGVAGELPPCCDTPCCDTGHWPCRDTPCRVTSRAMTPRVTPTVLHSGEYFLFESDSEEEEEAAVPEEPRPSRQSAFQVSTAGVGGLGGWWCLWGADGPCPLSPAKRSNVVQRALNTLRFLWVLCRALVDGLTQWLDACTREHADMSAVLRLERYVLTRRLAAGENVHRGLLDELYLPPLEEPPEELTPRVRAGRGHRAHPCPRAVPSRHQGATPAPEGYLQSAGSQEQVTTWGSQDNVAGSQELLALPQNRSRTASELLLSRRLYFPELEESEQFYRSHNRFLKLLLAGYLCVAAHSELLCYFIIILNNMVTASVISLFLPILVFLWAMLSIPRPSKRFWMTAIIFTEVMVVVKYLFQFGFFPWNGYAMLVRNEGKPFFPPRILGLEKSDRYIKYDLIQLLALFFHRSLLLSYGLWDHEEDPFPKKKAEAERVEDEEEEERREEAASPPLPASEEGTEALTEPGAPGAAVGLEPEGDAVGQEEGAGTTQLRFRRKRRRGKKQPEAAPEEGEHQFEEAEGVWAAGQALLRHHVSAPRCWLGGRDAGCSPRSPPSVPSRTQNMYQPVRRFFRDILHTQHRAATDVYAFMFLADVVDFIIIIFGFWAFGKHTAAADITSSLSDDQVPEAFLVMLLIQFTTMVIDRALYLRKTVLGKLIFQVILVFSIHLWMFFILPAVTERLFSLNTVAQLWYFVKCIYFSLSAYQIRCGYPTRILGNFLTKKYNHLNLFLFQGFRLVPFLVELRAVMDWVWTDTTLSLSNWMCVEDIYANIFIIKCSRETEKKYPQPKGQKKKKIVKYGMGGLIILFLVAIIWFPLLFMSLVRSVVGVVNHPIDVTVTLKLGGYEPLFTMSAQQQSIQPFTPQDYEALTNHFERQPVAMQFITLYGYEDIVTARIEGSSGSLWSISPPSREQMRRELQNGSSDITLRLTWTFQRDLGKGGTVEHTFDKHTTDLQPGAPQRLELAQLLQGTRDTPVQVPKLFPKYIRAPNGPEAHPVKQLLPDGEDSYLDVEVQLKRERAGAGRGGDSFLEWWVVRLKKEDPPHDGNILPMVIFNDKVSPPSLGFLAGYGIMGLYVSIVLVIGKFVRGFFSEISHSIMFEELPCVDRILKLCQDIFLVRETGELELEEELYAKLIFLYRSPETMIKWTREKE